MNVKIDHALGAALMELRRRETHTFHLPVGEAIMTLQDFALLLVLLIDGRAEPFPHAMICKPCTELLGATLDDRSLDGAGLRLW